MSEEAYGIIKNKAMGNLENGGRGIGNIVESTFINPLARYLFDEGIFEKGHVVIKAINADEMPYTLDCAVLERN